MRPTEAGRCWHVIFSEKYEDITDHSGWSRLVFCRPVIERDPMSNIVGSALTAARTNKGRHAVGVEKTGFSMKQERHARKERSETTMYGYAQRALSAKAFIILMTAWRTSQSVGPSAVAEPPPPPPPSPPPRRRAAASAAAFFNDSLYSKLLHTAAEVVIFLALLGGEAAEISAAVFSPGGTMLPSRPESSELSDSPSSTPDLSPSSHPLTSVPSSPSRPPPSVSPASPTAPPATAALEEAPAEARAPSAARAEPNKTGSRAED